MIDPDGRRGIGSVHWVAYGIPATRAGLKECEGGTPPADIYSRQELTGNDGLYRSVRTTYRRATPLRHRRHRARPRTTALQPGLDRDELLTMITGHSLGPASLVVRYRREQ